MTCGPHSTRQGAPFRATAALWREGDRSASTRQPLPGNTCQELRRQLTVQESIGSKVREEKQLWPEQSRPGAEGGFWVRAPALLLHAWGGCYSQTAKSCNATYVRFSVWKILEICSMTGPVSGSFIHWVLFSGFSSMSSNASNVLGLVSPSCTTGLSRIA